MRDFVDAVNARAWERLDALVAPAFRRHSHAAGQSVTSREALKRFLEQECETFPDGEETIEDMVVEGDKIAVRHRFTGTQSGALGSFPPSGKTLASEYIAIYRLEDGRIAEAWAEWDNLVALVQLGHHEPPPSGSAGASGNRTRQGRPGTQ